MRIFLMFDSMIIRNWIADQLLQDHRVSIIGEARTALTALGEIRHLQPDVLIMHSHDQKRFGIDILQSIRYVLPASKTIVLTTKQYDCCALDTARSDDADIFLNRFADWKKIPHILKKMGSEAACCSQDKDRLPREAVTGEGG